MNLKVVVKYTLDLHLLWAPYTLSETAQFNLKKKTARKTELNVL